MSKHALIGSFTPRALGTFQPLTMSFEAELVMKSTISLFLEPAFPVVASWHFQDTPSHHISPHVMIAT